MDRNVYDSAVVSVGLPFKSMVPSRMVLLLVTLVALVTAGQETKLGCRDQDGRLVDWYVIYKLPNKADIKTSLLDGSTAYVYYSSRESNERWVMPHVGLDCPDSLPGRTLQPLYDEPDRAGLIYAFYNDAMPNGTTTATKGHTKGVVAFDGSSGFWMVHSVPQFPPPPSEVYSYPDTGKQLGQSFLCVTLPVKKLETVAKQLYFNEPSLYAIKLPSSLKSTYPTMAKVIAGQHSSVKPKHSIVPLHNTKDVGGIRITSFARTSGSSEDLYHGLVARHLKISLGIQTRLGPVTNSDRLPSDCSDDGRKVYNIKKIQIKAQYSCGSVMFNFDNTVDNSKMAQSAISAQPWVCIGDIDRVSSQTKRGGGTVCLKSTELWTIYRRLVPNGAFEMC